METGTITQERPTIAEANIMLKNWLKFRGRMNRLDFLAIGFCLKGIGYLVDIIPENLWMIGLLAAIGFTYLQTCFAVARMHDIGISGYFVIPLLIIGIISGVVGNSLLIAALIVTSALALLLWPRQKRDNKYGPFRKYGFSHMRSK